MQQLAAILGRVSSDAQHIDAQLAHLRRQAAADGMLVVAEYVDDGVTGGTGNLQRRHGLQRMLADIAKLPPPWTVLYVFDVDRFLRSDEPEEQASIIGPLKRARVDVRTRTGAIPPLYTSFGRALAMLQLDAAAEWLEKHRARIKLGKERAIAAGKKPAGPTPFGLHYVRLTGSWSIDEDAAAVVREAFTRVAAGESCEVVAIDLERRHVARARAEGWTRHAVWRLVRSEVYRGRFVVDKAQERAIAVPALVDDATWYAAQRELVEHGKRGLRKTKHLYLLEGLATCAMCGAPIGINSARQREGQVGYYLCTTRRHTKRYTGAARCALPMRRTVDVDAAAWRELARMVATPDLLEETIARHRAGAAQEGQDWAGDLRRYEQRLEQLERAEGVVLERYRRGLVSETVMDKHLEAASRERQVLADQVATARRAQALAAADTRQVDGVLATLATLRARLEDASPEDRRELAIAVLAGGRVRRTLTLGPEELRGTATLRPAIGLAVASGWTPQHEANDELTVELPLRVSLGGRRRRR